MAAYGQRNVCKICQRIVHECIPPWWHIFACFTRFNFAHTINRQFAQYRRPNKEIKFSTFLRHVKTRIISQNSYCLHSHRIAQFTVNFSTFACIKKKKNDRWPDQTQYRKCCMKINKNLQWMSIAIGKHIQFCIVALALSLDSQLFLFLDEKFLFSFCCVESEKKII